MEKLKYFWANRKHYALHIFVAGMAMLVLMFAINLTLIGMKYNHNKKVQFADTAMYTGSFTTSLSKSTGSVERIFASEDDRQFFILLKYSDTSKISTDARNYSMLLTNVDSTGKSISVPEEGVKGRIYMFGATGYMAIYLYTTETPFTSDLKRLQVCSRSVLTRGEETSNQDANSLDNYDIFTLYLNPSGNDAPTASFLTDHQIGADFDMSIIYERLIYYPQEQEIKSELDTLTQSLRDNYNSLVEYRQRLKNYGLEIPEMSKFITGDKIETEYEYIYEYETDENGNVIVDEMTGEPIIKQDENGEYVIATDESGKQMYGDSYLNYKANAILPGGIMFDYHKYSLQSGGYVKALENEMDDMTLNEYLTALDEEAKTHNSEADKSIQISEWAYENGTPFIMDGTDTLTQTITADIDAYTAMLQSYLNNKRTYQREMLIRLLTLERNFNIISTVYTDTMHEVEVDVPKKDAEGNIITDAEGNPITEKQGMYVDDGILQVW